MSWRWWFRAAPSHPKPAPIRIGIIGLDTSHAIEFAKMFNGPEAPRELAGLRVVAAYPPGSPDIASSVSRVPGYTKTMQDMGVKIVDSLEQLVADVDVVLLESNDGRPHLEQALPGLRAGKRMFIDKPVAGSLTDAVAIYLAADHFRTPIFSASALRYHSGASARGRASSVMWWGATRSVLVRWSRRIPTCTGMACTVSSCCSP